MPASSMRLPAASTTPASACGTCTPRMSAASYGQPRGSWPRGGRPRIKHQLLSCGALDHHDLPHARRNAPAGLTLEDELGLIQTTAHLFSRQNRGDSRVTAECGDEIGLEAREQRRPGWRARPRSSACSRGARARRSSTYNSVERRPHRCAGHRQAPCTARHALHPSRMRVRRARAA